jgi:hypothetical protein
VTLPGRGSLPGRRTNVVGIDRGRLRSWPQGRRGPDGRPGGCFLGPRGTCSGGFGRPCRSRTSAAAFSMTDRIELGVGIHAEAGQVWRLVSEPDWFINQSAAAPPVITRVDAGRWVVRDERFWALCYPRGRATRTAIRGLPITGSEKRLYEEVGVRTDGPAVNGMRRPPVGAPIRAVPFGSRRRCAVPGWRGRRPEWSGQL